MHTCLDRPHVHLPDLTPITVTNTSANPAARTIPAIRPLLLQKIKHFESVGFSLALFLFSEISNHHKIGVKGGYNYDDITQFCQCMWIEIDNQCNVLKS